MPGPHNDDGPNLNQAVAFDVAEILEEYAPATPEDFDRLAAQAQASAASYIGGEVVARGVADELRRRAKAMRDAS
ncbi:hypothetical protein [Caulobacter segnis]